MIEDCNAQKHNKNYFEVREEHRIAVAVAAAARNVWYVHLDRLQY